MNKFLFLVYFRFMEMPIFLRFVFFPCSFLGGILLPLSSLIPSANFSINEKQVSWSEWWTSGAGPLSVVIGIFLLISAVGFFQKKRFARITFLAPWVILIIVAIVQENATMTVQGTFVLAIWMVFLIWYFFFKKTIKHYFRKN